MRWRSLGESCSGMGTGRLYSVEEIGKILDVRLTYNKWTRVFARLLRVYRECEAFFGRRGTACRQCGRCCDFSEFGHDLYVSSIEAAWMLYCGGIPQGFPEGPCPFLSEGACKNRFGRAVGCRTFFCEDDNDRTRAFHERLVRRVKEAAAKEELPWEYGRLDRMLAEVAAREGPWHPLFCLFSA